MQAQLNQAIALQQSGKFQSAEEIFKQLLQIEPENPVIQARLGLLYFQMQRLAESFPLMEYAINSLPQEIELLQRGIELASRLGKNLQVEKWLSKVLETSPDNIAANEQLAGVLVTNHKEKEALKVAKHVIRLDPKSANGFNLKGLALSRLGETEKGYKCFQKAVLLNPGQLGAIRNLIIYGKGKKEKVLEEIIPQLEQKIAQQAPPQIKMNIAYIISMYYDKLKVTEKSFQFLKLGNDINHSRLAYDPEKTEKQFEILKNSFTPAKVKLLEGEALQDASPIFILGMPRSGTTLIEQILSSHSLVGAEGEITDLKEAFEAHSVMLNDDVQDKDYLDAALSASNQYLNSVKARQSTQYFTDKMPYNFMLLGHIAATMPNAKIIHCTRNPLETCFSIYKQNFAGAHSYSNNLLDLAHYYKSYVSLMNYWSTLFPDRIYEANYESMVNDSEEQISKLLDFCQLESEAKCYEFHKNKRAVRTASVAQVRQPIYRDAIKASSLYKTQLLPLADALNA